MHAGALEEWAAAGAGYYKPVAEGNMHKDLGELKKLSPRAADDALLKHRRLFERVMPEILTKNSAVSD